MPRPQVIDIDKEWEEYYPKVYGYFFRRLNTREDIEDLTSLVLTTFLQTLSDPEKSLKIKSKHGYLWKIAHNQLATFVNTKSKHGIAVSLDENLESIDKEFDDQRSKGYTQKIDRLIKCIKNILKEQDYQILYMSIFEDRKSPEIGEILNLTALNVRKKLSRSLSKAREACATIWK